MSNKIPSVLDLTPNTERNFDAVVDGKKLEIHKKLVLTNKNIGTFEYGASPLGYDTIALEQANTGGAVIVPYLFIEKELFIGFVEQPRPNLMDAAGDYMVFNLPRGTALMKESFVDAAKRESSEEMGIQDEKILFKKLSPPLNNDSSFFVTIPAGKKGVSYFSAKFEVSDLVIHRKNVYKLHPNFNKIPEDIHEHISRSLFFHWTKVFDTYDAISWLGVLLLRESLNN